jgi:hypothetical protein
MLHFAEEDGVAEVEVGGRGVEAGFDAQGAASGVGGEEALAEVLFADDFGKAFAEVGELVFEDKHFY